MDLEMESELQSISAYEDNLFLVQDMEEEKKKWNYVICVDKDNAERELYISNELKEIVRANSMQGAFGKLMEKVYNGD